MASASRRHVSGCLDSGAVLLKPAVLASPSHPAVPPPHVQGPDYGSGTVMASTMAATHVEPVRVRVDGEPICADVRGYMKAVLRDRQLQPPQTATTMLASSAALQPTRGATRHPADPATCTHPSGLRGYGAGGDCVKICDLCGQSRNSSSVERLPRHIQLQGRPCNPPAKQPAQRPQCRRPDRRRTLGPRGGTLVFSPRARTG